MGLIINIIIKGLINSGSFFRTIPFYDSDTRFEYYNVYKNVLCCTKDF